MLQEELYSHASTRTVRSSYPLPASSLRDTITATIIREEAAESLLPGVQGDAELAALTHVLNRYNAQWWLQHLSSVGADPARYWRGQLGAEIKAAIRGKNSIAQGKSRDRRSLRSFSKRGTYDLSHLNLDPL